SDAPDLPRQPAKTPNVKPLPPKPETPAPDIAKQARMLKEYKEKQSKLQAKRDAEARRQAELKAKQQHDFEEMQRMQAKHERMAQEELMRQQMAGIAAGRVAELEQEIIAMRACLKGQDGQLATGSGSFVEKQVRGSGKIVFPTQGPKILTCSANLRPCNSKLTAHRRPLIGWRGCNVLELSLKR
ncbi:hypothetical protein BY996DRAFT_6428751, partial [Phakopsora pachyrhizi]